MSSNGSTEGTAVATFAGSEGVYTATYNIESAGDYHFYVYNDGNGKSYLNSSTTAFNGKNGNVLYPYGENNFTHVINLNASQTGTYFFKLTQNGDNVNLACAFPLYYLKNNWNNGDWDWIEMTNNGDGTYSVEAVFGGTGCNYNTSESDTGSEWIAVSKIAGSPVAGGKYMFTLSPLTQTLTAVAIPTVSLTAPRYAAMNEEITLVPTPVNFTGTVSYEYSVSIDGGDWTSLGSTATYIIGNHSYSFKVVASSDQSESATSDKVDVDLYTFTIAGIEALCGSDWNQTDANNDMTYSEGKYHWSNALVFYPGSEDYGFQVVKNHAWTNAFPSTAYNLSNTWKFESGIGYYSVNIDYTYPEGIEVTTTYLYPAIVKLASNNNNWDWASSPVMEWNDAKTICSASMVLETGLIPDSFKVVVTQGKSTKWFGDDYTMKRGETPWTLLTNTGNLRVCKDVNGEYGFAFNLNDTNIAVTYPKSFTRTVTAERAEYYQTLCVPFNATISGAKAYAYSEVDGAYVKLTEVSNLTAGEAYLIMPNGAGTITVTAANPANETATLAIHDNGFIGNLGETVELFAENSWSKYVLKNNEFHMIDGTASIIIESTKAYLHLASPVSGSAPSQLRIVLEENNTTDINSLKAEGEAVKFFENGQLYILRDGVVYDATGRAVR